MQQSKVKNLK